METPMTDRKKIVFATGKRKTAVAKALIKPGKGVVIVNRIPVEAIQPEAARIKVMEPIILAEGVAGQVDVKVNVQGGGFMAQAEACRMAIARGLTQWSKGEQLKKKLTEYDRSMLAGDQRRTEPKKFGGPGPRRRRQKSYR